MVLVLCPTITSDRLPIHTVLVLPARQLPCCPALPLPSFILLSPNPLSLILIPEGARTHRTSTHRARLSAYPCISAFEKHARPMGVV